MLSCSAVPGTWARFSSPLVVATLIAFLLCGCEPQPHGNSAATTQPSNTPDGSKKTGLEVAQERNCFAMCHVKGNPFRAPLFEDSVPQRRKLLANYELEVKRLKVLDRSTYDKNKVTIEKVLATRDPEQRLRAWLSAHLRNPSFSGASTMVPISPPLSDDEVKRLVDYLITLR